MQNHNPLFSFPRTAYITPFFELHTYIHEYNISVTRDKETAKKDRYKVNVEGKKRRRRNSFFCFVTLQFIQQEASNPPFPLVTTWRSEFALQKSPFQSIFVGYLAYISGIWMASRIGCQNEFTLMWTQQSGCKILGLHRLYSIKQASYQSMVHPHLFCLGELASCFSAKLEANNMLEVCSEVSEGNHIRNYSVCMSISGHVSYYRPNIHHMM